MITAPRVVRTVEQSLFELRRAGFDQPVHVFAEPRTGLRKRRGVVVHSSRKRLGMWPNWLRAANWLLHETDRPFLLLCEDDIRLTSCSALGLQHAIDTLPHDTWGYASLYTPVHNVSEHNCTVGWQTVMSSRSFWGSLAYCFTRQSLADLLACDMIVNHAWDRGTDTVVSRALKKLGRCCYFHVPSLCDHAGGGISSVGHANVAEMAAVGYAHDYQGYRAAVE